MAVRFPRSRRALKWLGIALSLIAVGLVVVFPGARLPLAFTVATGLGRDALQTRIDAIERKAIRRQGLTEDDRDFLVDFHSTLATGAKLQQPEHPCLVRMARLDLKAQRRTPHRVAALSAVPSQLQFGSDGGRHGLEVVEHRTLPAVFRADANEKVVGVQLGVRALTVDAHPTISLERREGIGELLVTAANEALDAARGRARIAVNPTPDHVL